MWRGTGCVLINMKIRIALTLLREKEDSSSRRIYSRSEDVASSLQAEPSFARL
jgi:hypothetical protein